MNRCKKPLIETHKELILFLNKLSPQKRTKFISILKKNDIDCIAEVFTNFLKRNLTQDTDIIKKVRKYHKDIRSVARKRTPLKHKLKILTSQRGGFVLSVLLPLAASIITSLVSR